MQPLKVMASETSFTGVGKNKPPHVPLVWDQPHILPHKAPTPYPKTRSSTKQDRQEATRKPTPYIFQKEGVQNYPKQKKSLTDKSSKNTNVPASKEQSGSLG